MAKSLGGWSTVRAQKEDAGGAKEAAALFTKQEELRKENNKIKNLFTQNMLKTFYNSMNAFDTKQDTKISESGVLDQTYEAADGTKIQMFQRTKDASHFNPFGGKFRKLKDRVEFSDEFKELLKDPNARYKFLNDPKYQKIISKYDTQGFVDWKAQDAKLAFQTEGFKEVQAAGGPEAYKEQREFDTFFAGEEQDIQSSEVDSNIISTPQVAPVVKAVDELNAENQKEMREAIEADYSKKGWELPENFEETGGVISQKDAREIGLKEGYLYYDNNEDGTRTLKQRSDEERKEFLLNPVERVIGWENRFKIEQPDMFEGLNPSFNEAVSESTNPFDNQDVFDLVDKDAISESYITSVNTAWDDINKIGL